MCDGGGGGCGDWDVGDRDNTDNLISGLLFCSPSGGKPGYAHVLWFFAKQSYKFMNSI